MSATGEHEVGSAGSDVGPMDPAVRHLRRAQQFLIDSASWDEESRVLVLAELFAIVEHDDPESPLFELLDRAVVDV